MNQPPVLILAAGEGSRFGGLKQLAMLQEKPLLQHVIDQVLAHGLTPFVCLGANHAKIENSPLIDLTQCQIVSVPDWQTGMSAAIKAGIEALAKRENLAGVVIMLADQPVYAEGYLARFAEQISKHPDTLLATCYEHGSGVPAYFPRQYFEQLAQLEGDQGARRLLKGAQPALIDPGHPIEDVDIQEDLRRLESP